MRVVYVFQSENRSKIDKFSRVIKLPEMKTPEGHLHYQEKDFLSNCTSQCLQKNISQNARLDHPNPNTSQSSYDIYRYFAARNFEFKWDFKSG